jgi:hypothetical protein
MQLIWGKLPVTVCLPAVVFLLFGSAAAHAGAAETYYFFVFSNPVADYEDEYNKWYDQQHTLDVVSIPVLLPRRGW